MGSDRNIKGHLSLFIAYVIFGLNTPISKAIFIDGEVSAFALTFFRFSGATVLFWSFSLFSKKEKVPARDIRLLFLASLFGILLNQMSFVVGLSLTSPIDASVITTVVPILTMILAAFFLKEPITWVKTIGVFIGAAGALLLILNSNTAGGSSTNMVGNLLCVLGSLSFAIYLTAFKKLISRYSPVTLMKWMFLFATICSLPLCWKDVTTINYLSLPRNIYLDILFVLVFATFVSYLLIPIGQKTLRPTVVGMYNYLQPLISSLVAVVMGMDTFGWLKGVAALLIFSGVYIVTHSKSRAQLEAEKNHSSQPVAK